MLTKKVWTPVDVKSLTYEERERIIRSSMFLKDKFLASGEFEKLKARLVAGGDQQDKSLYDDSRDKLGVYNAQHCGTRGQEHISR